MSNMKNRASAKPNSNGTAWLQISNGTGRFASTLKPPVTRMLAGIVLAKDAVDQLQNRFVRLTSREIEVLQLIAEGNGNKQTAAELGINVKTVEKHRGSIMQKLEIHHTAGLTRCAICAGILEDSVQLFSC